MAVFKPFPAVRPRSEYCARTLCPPYDVVSRTEAAEWSADPVSFMRVTRTDAALPEEMEYSSESYELSGSIFHDMLAEGIYFQDVTPHYYIYSETFGEHTQTGIVGCASIDEYDNGIIKQHEKTFPSKETDRILHFSACGANTEPVFLTYRDDDHIRQMTTRIMEEGSPDYQAEDSSGVIHRLWCVKDDSANLLLEQMFLDVNALYIADGHHRTASAVKVGHLKRESFPQYTGEEEFNRFMAVAFPESDLLILPYNRLIKELKGLSPEELLDGIRKVADLHHSEDGGAPLQSTHCFKIYINGSWHTAAFHPDLIDEDDPVKSLDVSLLQDYILAPLLGIRDPRTDPLLSFSGGINSTEQMVLAVDSGKAAAAILLHPITVRDMMKVADNGMIMPPKSTWFEPKIGSGWFIHRID